MTGVQYLYRYEIEYKSEDGDTNVYLRELKVLEETEKTYVVQDSYWRKRRVKKDAYNTFAYAQKDKALAHFKRRTAKRIAWFEFWTEECEKALKLAEEVKSE